MNPDKFLPDRKIPVWGQLGCEMSTASSVTRSSITGTNINNLTPGSGSLRTEISESAASRGVDISWPLKREEQEQKLQETNSQNTCEIPHRDSKNSLRANGRVLRVGGGRESHFAK